MIQELVRKIYVYGSVHRWSISVTVQRDETPCSLFIILQVHSTCFECQPHPSSGVHKTVTTASGTGQLLSSYLPPAWPSWREETCRVKLQNNKWSVFVLHLFRQLLIWQENVCVAYYFVNEKLTPTAVTAGGNLGRDTVTCVCMYVWSEVWYMIWFNIC